MTLSRATEPMTNPEQIEAVARAWFETNSSGAIWENASQLEREHARGEARQFLAMFNAAIQIDG